MFLKRLINGLSRKRSGIALLSGVAAVLVGVEYLVAPRKPVKAVSPKPLARAPRTDYFSVRRTQSDLGFTYWVLQGHGCFSSFALFDTWREAIDEANRRLAAAPVRSTAAKFEYAAPAC